MLPPETELVWNRLRRDILMNEHGFGGSDYIAAFQEANIPSHWELGMKRLCSGAPQTADEGFDTLMDSPPSVHTMTTYFRSLRDSLERDLAAESEGA